MSQSNKNKTTVHIYNRKYTIVGEEHPHHMQVIASMVDEKMREIQEANPSLDTAKLAVLTAVNAMNDYVKIDEEYTSLIEQMRRGERRKNG
ncbi:cell division protein ZapA [Salinibacillus xinjiangensis]|uniref:Cell division protein ZapA n=1 Tax=Salinibacillus xinjiangensis TaxID=1229268 RepID=A0A6G1XBK3_9BACI|nr:cell division protein ZapA [Salinibacillus xinjiangensis]MRG88393.1 cell division protein ZapA [Salinibacillus xinjiangensis]